MPVQIMLKLIRLIHTAIWVLLAGCVLGFQSRRGVAVLTGTGSHSAGNYRMRGAGRQPLAMPTDACRRPVYGRPPRSFRSLPSRLARPHNKQTFAALFVIRRWAETNSPFPLRSSMGS